MDVGNRIKELRENKNITVNKLATISGVSQSYLRDIELGNKKPTVDYLEYICYGLGISLSEFFKTDENENDDFLSTISKLTENQKSLLQQFIKSFSDK